MGCDFPELYRYSRTEACHRGELQRYEDSFHLNVSCARAIEQAIRCNFNGETKELTTECARPVLEQYGFKRVNFVLANSLKEIHGSDSRQLIHNDTYRWGCGNFVPDDGKYNHYFEADTAAPLLESFIGQVRAAYQALGLFGSEQCEPAPKEGLDYTRKVLILRPDVLKESYWEPKYQLWYAESGFGCSPNARGRAIFATCLGNGETARWNRWDFLGPIKEELIPEWAKEKLTQIQAQRQESLGMNMV